MLQKQVKIQVNILALYPQHNSWTFLFFRCRIGCTNGL